MERTTRIGIIYYMSMIYWAEKMEVIGEYTPYRKTQI